MKKSEETKGIAGAGVKSAAPSTCSTGGTATIASSSHIRSGGAGKWRDYFTVRQNERFDKVHERALERGAGAGLGAAMAIDFGEGDMRSKGDKEVDRLISILEGTDVQEEEGAGICAIM